MSSYEQIEYRLQTADVSVYDYVCRYPRAQLAPYLDMEPPLLSSAALRDMHRVHHVMDPSRGGSGLGWGVEISSGQHIVYHGGELPDQTSFVPIDLESGSALSY